MADTQYLAEAGVALVHLDVPKVIEAWAPYAGDLDANLALMLWMASEEELVAYRGVLAPTEEQIRCVVSIAQVTAEQAMLSLFRRA